MACLSNYTLKGILADCNPNLAGIQEAYLGYFGDFDVTVNVSAQTVSSISAATGATSGKFYHYTFAMIITSKYIRIDGTETCIIHSFYMHISKSST